ncbi:hypothetical protein O6H91_03G068200 [Diphasiastrum complanatum]|uniref:Uncharacterized protein n=1 Tax=Diphasiastrum complanatum TaxID=34168 RepID=A0ACC2E7E5_DIPCM|nr:hypothetical protein O6H91_03G068200 [Diphasiastrum complanatum]
MQPHHSRAASCDGDAIRHDDEAAFNCHQKQSPHKDDKPWHSYDTVFLNAKAGMDGVDKEKVQKVVYEMSKGSRYFENEKRKEAVVEQRIDRLRSQACLITAAGLASLEKVVDKKIGELEANRDLSRVWIHVDLDAFYAAVETQENPSLKGKPMAVGGLSMICTANYEARKFGVRAAMPGFIARKLCQDLIFVRPDFEKYSKYSELTRQVFREYDERFIARSMDEAYLDVTDICRERTISGAQVAEEIRHHVYEKTKLTCSAGVGPNRLLAKVCSDINKPNGQYVLPNERSAIMNFISALPIRKVSGIGKVTERMLKDVLDFFFSVGLAIGGSEPPQDEPRKSLSNERTFMATTDESFFSKKLEELAEALAVDMAKEGLQGRTLTLKLKTASFEVRTRAVSLHQYIFSKSDILLHASKLLKAEVPLSLRLIGLRLANFKGEMFACLSPSQRTLASYLNQNTSPYKTPGVTDICEYETMNSMPHRESSPKSIDQDNENEDLRLSFKAHVGRRLNLSYKSDGLQNPNYKHEDGQVVTSKRLDRDPLTHGTLQQSLLKPGETYLAGEEASIVLQRRGIDSCGSHFESKLCASWDSMEKPSTSLNVDALTCKAESEMGFRSSLLDSIGIEDQVAAESSTSILQIDRSTHVKSEATNLLQTSSFTWIEDFRCSVCGIEVPAELISIRQEHEDYHLAQLLQEESGGMGLWSNHNDSFQKQIGKRCLREESGTRRKLSKKDANCLPIDAYFVKNRFSP